MARLHAHREAVAIVFAAPDAAEGVILVLQAGVFADDVDVSARFREVASIKREAELIVVARAVVERAVALGVGEGAAENPFIGRSDAMIVPELQRREFVFQILRAELAFTRHHAGPDAVVVVAAAQVAESLEHIVVLSTPGEHRRRSHFAHADVECVGRLVHENDSAVRIGLSRELAHDGARRRGHALLLAAVFDGDRIGRLLHARGKVIRIELLGHVGRDFDRHAAVVRADLRLARRKIVHLNDHIGRIGNGSDLDALPEHLELPVGSRERAHLGNRRFAHEVEESEPLVRLRRHEQFELVHFKRLAFVGGVRRRQGAGLEFACPQIAEMPSHLHFAGNGHFAFIGKMSLMIGLGRRERARSQS